MTEYIIILPVLFLLVFGAIQFALIYHAKTTLNYAAFEATRIGALQNGNHYDIKTAFFRAMAPLYTHEPDFESVLAARERMAQEPDRLCIERLNPPDKAFDHFGLQDEATGRNVIPNDNLMYRAPDPVGISEDASDSGKNRNLSLHDANLLKLRINYCYELVVPFIKDAIRILLGTGETDPLHNPDGEWHKGFKEAKGFRQRCLTQMSGLPLQAQAIMRMQSPAFDDDRFAESCD